MSNEKYVYDLGKLDGQIIKLIDTRNIMMEKVDASIRDFTGKIIPIEIIKGFKSISNDTFNK